MENDLFQLWRLVAELSDQLAQNRAITASLQAQAGSVKSAASHQGTGFALRRFNMHMTQEAFESELERMNAIFIQQNVKLQNDNKQLAALLKEYEQTLETVMSKFRTHAHASQQHELSLTRHYESLLLSRETSLLFSDLAASTAHSHSLTRMSHLLRAALRACGGEPSEDEISNDARHVEREQGGYVEGSGMEDWALERESELIRLEYENYELRRMLGIPPPMSPESSLSDLPTRIESTVEGEKQQSGLGMFTGSLNQDSGDDLSLRRQPMHTQGLTQISLEGPQQSHAQTQPLHIAFPPDAPLVTRKYGRRAGSGSGSFIGGAATFKNSEVHHEYKGAGSAQISAAVTGEPHPMRLNLYGPSRDEEEKVALSLLEQDHAKSKSGREGGVREGHQELPWDGLYSREDGRHASPPSDT